MKVIDLLVKIANGEEVPKKFKIKEDYYNNRIFSYNKVDEWFDDLNDTFYCKDNIIFDELNDEVEIIEDTPKEDKKIEKFKVIKDNSGDSVQLIYDGMKLDLTLLQAIILDKINEIIDKVNGE